MSMSNRARRMALHHLRHRADAQLNLIPLIDILSVMVAFLLVYSAQVQVIHNGKGVHIPESIAHRTPHPTVIVTVTRSEVFVQGEEVATISEVQRQPGNVIGALRAALERPRIGGARQSPVAAARREVTIMADKSLPYEVLKKVMSTCTDAHFQRIALAVLEREKPVAARQLQSS